MNKLLPTIALLLASANVVIGQTCDASLHLEWKSCGSACRDYCNQEPGPCTLQCVADCYCDDPNYTRKAIDSGNYDCIHVNDCPAPCGPNKVYKECGSMCPDYCGNPGDIMCPALCVEGCFCKDGYILENENSTNCIPIDDPTCCGANKVYKECGTMCPDYCGKPENTACAAVCVEGCFCKDGYKLESENSSTCIPEENCPSED